MHQQMFRSDTLSPVPLSTELGDEGHAFGQLLTVMREEAREAGETAGCASFCAELALLCDKREGVQAEVRDQAAEEGE